MAIKRSELEKLLEGVEKKDDIINYVMAENGNSINAANAKYEELKTKYDELNAQFEDHKKATGDYETIKKSKDDLQKEIDGYKAKEANKVYFDKLNSLGFDSTFVDEDIFKRIPKVENDGDLKKWEENAKKFLAEHPKFRNEAVVEKGGFQFKGSTDPDNPQSDEELLKQLRDSHKPQQ